MFEVPQAKRVRRAELDASNDSASETDDEVYDAEWQARLNAQIARSLGITESYAQPAAAAVVVAKEPHSADALDEPEDDDAMEEAEEFAFRMFSTAKPAQKIVLEEDAGPTGDGTFTTKRPLSYYVVTALSQTQRQQYAAAAVSGEDVLLRSKGRSWGLELPWKVTNIAITRNKRAPGPSGGPSTDDEEAAAKKRRPGKKQRISQRRRAREKEAKQREATQKVADKEEHLKEKKKRLNRVKKLRKRAKNKEAKAAGEGGGDGDGSDSDGLE